MTGQGLKVYSSEACKVWRAFGTIVDSKKENKYSSFRPSEERISAAEKVLDKYKIPYTSVNEPPQKFLDVASGIIKKDMEMENYNFESYSKRFVVSPQMRFISKDSKIDGHRKHCIIDQNPRYDGKHKDQIYYNCRFLITSPMSAFNGNLSKYLPEKEKCMNPYAAIAQFCCDHNDKEKGNPRLNNLAKLGEVIQDIVGAWKVSYLHKGQDTWPDFKGGSICWTPKQDLLGMQFRNLQELEEAYPVVLKAWEVFEKNPELAEKLVAARGRLDHTDDLFASGVVDGRRGPTNMWIWGIHDLNKLEKQWNDYTSVLVQGLDQEYQKDFKKIMRKRNSSVRILKRKIRKETKRRNQEYSKLFNQFKELVGVGTEFAVKEVKRGDSRVGILGAIL